MATMAAVDLGAQSGRVVLGRFDGERLRVSDLHRFDNVPVRTRGVLQWDVLRLFGDVLAGLRAAARDGAHVDSVGVDSWGVDFGLLDRQGRLVQNPVHYRDARRAGAVDRVLERVPARALYERTGIQLMPINTVFELAAMAAERDPALDAAETLVLIPDLFHYWLGGPRAGEHTNATTTQCFDPRAQAWAHDVLEALDVPAGLMPELVPPGTLLAPVADEVADDARLHGTMIVAGATHDTAAAVAAIPFRGPGSIFISAGTWSLVGLELAQPLIDDRTFEANLTNEGGVAGTFRLLRNVTGLWLLHECRRAWALEGRKHSFEELVALAVTADPFRSLIDPNDPVFASPDDMPKRIRDFCVRTNQPAPGEPAAVTRCVLESLALKHAQTIELLRTATGVEPGGVHVVGGGARNELLCRWTADASGLPVVCGPDEAAAVGNLCVQAIALGELESIADARELVRASFPPTVVEPETTPAWREAAGRFEAIAAAQRFEEVEA